MTVILILFFLITETNDDTQAKDLEKKLVCKGEGEHLHHHLPASRTCLNRQHKRTHLGLCLWICLPFSPDKSSELNRGRLWRYWNPLPDHLHQLPSQKFMWVGLTPEALNVVDIVYMWQLEFTAPFMVPFQIMTRTLWAAPMSPMRKMMTRGATASSSPISGPPTRARCPLPETAEYAHFCCARSVSVNGRNSSPSSARTGYRQELTAQPLLSLSWMLIVFFSAVL